MNKMRLIGRRCTLGIVAAVCCFAFSGCEYEVPITSTPTCKVDERLLGDWTSKDGKDKMKVSIPAGFPPPDSHDLSPTPLRSISSYTFLRLMATSYVSRTQKNRLE